MSRLSVATSVQHWPVSFKYNLNVINVNGKFICVGHLLIWCYRYLK